MTTSGATQGRELRGPLGVFRAAIIAVSALLCVEPSRNRNALFVLLALALGAWLSYRSTRFAAVSPYVGALLVSIAVPLTGGSESALLPYLLTSGFSVGLAAGARELLLLSVGTAGTLVLAGLVGPDSTLTGDFLVVGAQWVLLSLAVGLIARWSRRVLARPPQFDEYGEVKRLLEQLRNLTRRLPGSLDAAAVAEALLGDCSRVAAFDLAAVVVESGEGVFVPLAVTGATRVPWRTPLDDAGPLRSAWLTGQPVTERRATDTLGRRRGSTLLALPLLSTHGPYGLVILDAKADDAFGPGVTDALVQAVNAVAPHLETALLFEEVRLEASTEERDRLARDMHDGIAQELASFGYLLDDLKLKAGAVNVELADQAGEVRRALTALIADLRLSITDLRTTLRPERGLGAVLGTYLRAVCEGRQITLTMSLQETGFRLPADQEACLLRAAHVFAQEVRQGSGVGVLTVRLVVDPPSAVLHLSCDTALPQLHLAPVRASVERLGGEIVSGGTSGESFLTICLKGGRDDADSAAGGRSRPDPRGAEAGLRAD